MKKRFLLLIIFFTFLSSFISFLLILNYLDPYEHNLIGIILITSTFIFSLSGISTILIYILKKVYYRGEVFLYHVLTSFRQGFLFSFFVSGIIFFIIIGVNIFLTSISLLAFLILIELFFKNLET